MRVNEPLTFSLSSIIISDADCDVAQKNLIMEQVLAYVEAFDRAPMCEWLS